MAFLVILVIRSVSKRLRGGSKRRAGFVSRRGVYEAQTLVLSKLEWAGKLFWGFPVLIAHQQRLARLALLFPQLCECRLNQ